MAGESEDDWLFDYLLETFRSPSWEVPVMTFIDENCVIFDNDEENKFVYSEKHDEFCQLIDNLLSTHLSEIGVSEAQFAKVVELGYEKRDINRKVFDQIIACDDFLTFKKMMVKRNIQLELEVVKEMQNVDGNLQFQEGKESLYERVKSGKNSNHFEGAKTVVAAKDSGTNIAGIEACELKAAMEANLIEMQVYAKQMELEQAELEQALAISLKVEEERLYRLRKLSQQPKATKKSAKSQVDFKDWVDMKADLEEPKVREGNKLADLEPGDQDAEYKKKVAEREKLGGENRNKNVTKGDELLTNHQEQLKPIVSRTSYTSSKAVEINNNDDACAKIPSLIEYQKRKSAALIQFQKNREEVEKRNAERCDFERQSNFTQYEIDRRAVYLQEQRKILMEKKRREREVQLQDYERKRASGAKSQDETVHPSQQEVRVPKGNDDKSEERESNLQMKRRQMVLKLGLQMKKEILDEEDSRSNVRQVEQFSSLDNQLRKAEKMRQERRRQHNERLDRIRQDKLQRAMNVQSSSFANRFKDTIDEFSFKEQ